MITLYDEFLIVFDQFKIEIFLYMVYFSEL